MPVSQVKPDQKPSEKEKQHYKKAKQIVTEYTIGISNVSEKRYKKALTEVRRFERKYSPV